MKLNFLSDLGNKDDGSNFESTFKLFVYILSCYFITKNSIDFIIGGQFLFLSSLLVFTLILPLYKGHSFSSKSLLLPSTFLIFLAGLFFGPKFLTLANHHHLLFWIVTYYCLFSFYKRKKITEFNNGMKWFLIIVLGLAFAHKISSSFADGHFLSEGFLRGSLFFRVAPTSEIFQNFFPETFEVLKQNDMTHKDFLYFILPSANYKVPFDLGLIKYFSMFLASFVVLLQGLLILLTVSGKGERIFHWSFCLLLWGQALVTIEFQFLAIMSFLGIFSYSNIKLSWKKFYYMQSLFFCLLNFVKYVASWPILDQNGFSRVLLFLITASLIYLGENFRSFENSKKVGPA